MKVFQKGFNFSQDGPGNRLVYHVAGCNMHCRWCSNPEGMQIRGTETEYTPEDIVKEAISCKMMFFDGGGVTFTGGEATLDAKELIATLKGLKDAGINTALETNGTSPHLLEIALHLDHLMMDFKHHDDEKLLTYTGMSGETIRANYEALCKGGFPCHIRIPLIYEFNGDAAKGIANYLSQHDTRNITFELLRYHEYGREKWQDAYGITDGFITDEVFDQFIREMERCGLHCINT
ncbi:MAG: radical SAM protein [Ruminococcaceae bacterium]|nr:radical SAM protein [Oscillospiraceae bacterium]